MRCWKAALLAAAMLMSEVFGGGTLYLVGESGHCGTTVLNSPGVSSIILCAAACSTIPGCVGFNWRSSTRGCDLLSSLGSTVADPSCNIYVAEVVRTSLPLSYSCSTCMGSPPKGTLTWEHDCPDRGVAVGVASTSSLSDLDYLLCIHPSGMIIDLGNGGYVSDDRICAHFFSGRPFPVIGLWANEQYFNAPTNFRYHCREMISGQKLDLNRCMTSQSSRGAIPAIQGYGHELLVCPPHMVAASFYWNPTTLNLKLTCCLLYT